MWTQPIYFVYASVQAIFAYRKINRARVIKSNTWKCSKGESERQQNRSYLTGAINSSIMMSTIAEVPERTRRGQTVCYTHFLPKCVQCVTSSTVSFPDQLHCCEQVNFQNTAVFPAPNFIFI